MNKDLMRNNYFTCLIFWSTLMGFMVPTTQAQPNLLWYDSPAEKWIEALPIGNGRLGAMVFGQPRNERVQLNEITIWSHGPQPDADRKDAYKNLPELRKLIREGKYADAEKFANANFNGPAPYDASYQMLGDLNLDFDLPGDVSDYRRQLDIGQAIASVRFKSGDVTFERECFSSAPAAAIVQRITADRPGAVSFTMSLTRPARAVTRFVAPATLEMTGDTGNVLKFISHARLVCKGGDLQGTDDGKLIVRGADEAIVILTASTNYELNHSKSYIGGDLAASEKHNRLAADQSYDALKTAHVADYRKYFDRVELNLGKHDTTASTRERLKRYRSNPDPAFVSLFYQFGRYLLISSSRPDNPLPANLQGIWGDGLNLPWNCDFHTNINVQMNYWPAESANLSELHLPLIRLTQNLVQPGSRTAKAYFGPDTPGWVLGYTTNAWGWTSPGARLSWGIWFGGSAWLCQHLWEHYAYSGDIEYLRSVYPTMKSAAEFWLATLVEDADGKLITSPSTSPENYFTTDTGVHSSITQGAAMDRAMVWELFDNVAIACAVLGTDQAFAQKVIAARDRIRPPQIGKAGQLMEWNGDWDMNARELHHRHVSHLYPFHPGHQITMNGTPELAAAVRKSLEIRGDDGTGWALAWKINLWARLRDGDHALNLISNQLRYTEELKTVMEGAGGTYPNLFDAHPPFQIDGNLGFVSGINELLLQSHERHVDATDFGRLRFYIDVLPALPTAWPEGSVKGLRARGGFEVDLSWTDGKLGELTLRSSHDSQTTIRYRGQQMPVSLEKGGQVTLRLAGEHLKAVEVAPTSNPRHRESSE